MKDQIHITAPDRDRLFASMERVEMQGGALESRHIRQLHHELDRATIVEDPRQMPPNVVTMRSRVRLRDDRNGRAEEYTLVYPEESEPMERRISVLAPLGAAMLGHRAGDSFAVELPAGTVRYSVEHLAYQPEAAGHYHL
jgi:regulator of nucleoside diphosphate kinase